MSDVVFAAEPGIRTAPQPIRVMFNTRLSLPAGRYRIVATPAPGATLSGDLGVQVGRRGPPLLVWPLSPDSTSAEFALDLDAGFVGFVAASDVESRIARLDLTPLDVVDAGRRAPRPPVIAATRDDGLTLYFHDDRTYVETGGFWTKGHTTVDLTLARSDPSRPAAAGVRLRAPGKQPDPDAGDAGHTGLVHARHGSARRSRRGHRAVARRSPDPSAGGYCRLRLRPCPAGRRSRRPAIARLLRPDRRSQRRDGAGTC